MPASTEQVTSRLAAIDAKQAAGPELLGQLYEIVEDAESLPDPKLLLSPIFQFFEKWPSADLGAPGPLVHFVEQFSPADYEGLLLESLHREPVSQTVWMANRLLNSTELTEGLRAQLTSALDKVAANPRYSAAVRREAKEFLEHQHTVEIGT